MDREITAERRAEWRPTDRPTAVSATGRAELRWDCDVREGLGKMRIQNWSKMAMDRKAWKRAKQTTSVRYNSVE
jgi:hypothetical protein